MSFSVINNASTFSKLLYEGTKQQYINLQNKDSNALYFLSDTGEIYKGETRYGLGNDGILTYVMLTGVLLASNWSNNTQTVTINGISSSSIGSIGLLNTATSAQIEAATQAVITPTTISTNSITFTCENTPSIDIPFGVFLGYSQEDSYDEAIVAARYNPTYQIDKSAFATFLSSISSGSTLHFDIYYNHKDDFEYVNGTILEYGASSADTSMINGFIDGTDVYILARNVSAKIILPIDSSNLFSSSKIIAINFSDMMDTTIVTNYSGMFSGCTSLTSINLSTFDTSAAINMSSMFNNCSALTTLNLSIFDTANVTNMSSMFNGCINLTKLDLSNFNTAKVTNMSSMFNGCEKLESLNIDGFNTNRVSDMSSMFRGCESLETINATELKTSFVTNMSHMFDSCVSLIGLNLMTFDTSAVTDMSYMFNDCNTLVTIYVSLDFVTTIVTVDTGMFAGCTSLKGGANTTYNASHIDDTYAVIDDTGTPGYFTRKVISEDGNWELM